LARSESKTIPTGGDVHAFIAAVADEQRRRDAQLLDELFAKVTGEPPVLWGTAIVGFGSRHYRYESGREGDGPGGELLTSQGADSAVPDWSLG
jgi:hypothetical protein